MKKLKLQALNLSVKDLLSREQMKKVLGGSGSGSGTIKYYCSCTMHSSQPGGSSVSVPISSADSTSSTDCSSACKTYCDNATYCGSYTSVWGSSS
jgi:hypothetical protein